MGSEMCIRDRAWVQPKYASTYAKLCLDFSKTNVSKFKYIESKDDKKAQNPFKTYLIEKVQQTFNIKYNEDFETKEEQDKYITSIKKKILGNVKFIAELIRIKVLKRKIAKYCINHLLMTFLVYHAMHANTGKFIYSHYDHYIEATIEFIEYIGEKFDQLDESKEKDGKSSKTVDQNIPEENYENTVKKIEELLKLPKMTPNE